MRTIEDNKGPSGFVRLTLDTHSLEIEAKQVDNTTNLLRLMMMLALAIGIILARTLLQNRRSRWRNDVGKRTPTRAPQTTLSRPRPPGAALARIAQQDRFQRHFNHVVEGGLAIGRA